MNTDLQSVTGVTSNCKVLFVGDPVYLPAIRLFTCKVKIARRPADLAKIAKSKKEYDFVIILRNKMLTTDLICDSYSTLRKDGTIVFMTDDDGLLEAFSDIISEAWPLCEVSILNCDIGEIAVAKPTGSPSHRN